jgi:electron transfer flavoprotein alpha subunit
MGDVLVYTDPSGDSERLIAWARTVATAAGGEVIALVAGAEPAGDALTGADVVLEVSHPALSEYLPEAHEAVLVAAIEARKPEIVLVENTTAGYDLGAAAAAATGLPMVGYCVGLSVNSGKVESTSAVYGGQLLASVETTLPAVFAMNSSAMHETSAPPGRGERVGLEAPAKLDGLRTTFVEAIVPSTEDVDLTKAERIICVGRGIGGAENIAIAEELAEALGAEIAGSRPVIDSGWLPKTRQVGKSGARVKPKLYLTLGVSGAPEHVEGMQAAELIVAINKDPGAAIFNVAHYGVVADLFDVADELTSVLA